MLVNSMIAAAAGLVLAAFYANKVLSIKVTDLRVEELSTAIRQGSMAFLKRMYSWISVFVVILAILISTLTEWGYPWGSVAFVAGALLSSLAGFVGMRIATAANGRTTEAARDGGTLKALPVAFRGGAVMGFTVAGLGLLGVALGYLLFIEVLDLPNGYDVLAAIGLGGSSIALFARVGGGIYTKAADVGADLVGKVEAGIPEDDPRNPATIADNVGDNVGDVAGMGADLFESYVGSLVAPLAYAAIVFAGQSVLPSLLLFPLAVGTIGMGASILSSFLVVPKEGKLAQALHRGTYSAALLTVIGVYFLSDFMFADYAENPIGLFFSVIIELVAIHCYSMVCWYVLAILLAHFAQFHRVLLSELFSINLKCRSKYKADDCHNFNNNIHCRTRCIFKRISNCITNHSSFMFIRTLSCSTSSFNIFFCVIPSPTRVCHKYCQEKPSNQRPSKETSECLLVPKTNY